MLYIHIPFCHRKCIYCAFYSIPDRKRVHEYVDAIIKEIEGRREEQHGPVKTVYFGGGTPSILPKEELNRIIEALQANFDISQLEEATIECNPEDIIENTEQFTLNSSLFTRLSIGIQSFDDEILRFIGRRHSGKEAVDAVCQASKAGFENITIDLIYGIPGLTTEKWGDTLSQALQLPVQHLSAYSLTKEPDTALDKLVEMGKATMPDDEVVVEQYNMLLQWTKEYGFEQYEISNFCRPGFRSKHNSRYWNRTPYVGLGASAHSFDGKNRCWNVRNVDAYIANPLKPENLERLTEADAYNELLMTAFRTTDGLDVNLLPEKFYGSFLIEVKPFVDCGWLKINGCNYMPAEEGLLHADGMAAAMFVKK